MIYNADEFGTYSLKFLLKAASLHVPREYLEMAFQASIEYLDRLARYQDGEYELEEEEAEPDLPMMIDVVGQLLLTSTYQPPASPMKARRACILRTSLGMSRRSPKKRWPASRSC